MKIKNVHIHNFRSILDADFPFSDYTIIAGENNSGKTTFINALRVFYEDIKYDKDADFPKLKNADKLDGESWIEIEYFTTEEEQSSLKEEYRDANKILKVRKLLSSQKEVLKSTQSNIYAYEKGELSSNLFYGAKNISQAKLGKIIFIPELSRTEEALNLSKASSPLKSMVEYILDKILKASASFNELNSNFDKFNKDFQKESSPEGLSINKMKDDINKELDGWGVQFGIDINPISSDIITKNLLSNYLQDTRLGGQDISTVSVGQGLQRHIIYSLIKLAAKYKDTTEPAKKEFSPNFILVLFEEPEAFLHPSQQEVLDVQLRDLSKSDSDQIVITTHSPIFVSRNIGELPSLIKLGREKSNNWETKSFNISKEGLDALLEDNNGLMECLKKHSLEATCSQALMNSINNDLAQGEISGFDNLDKELLNICMWLDSERSKAFFAKHVIICEGATEKAFLEYLFANYWPEFIQKHIYCLDALGKRNIHRFINILSKLGIYHSVIYDLDGCKEKEKIVNEFINNNKTVFTLNLFAFADDIETYFGIPTPNKHLKPASMLLHLVKGKIPKEKVDKFKETFNYLLT